MKFCTKCGKELMDDAVICPACGCATEEKSPASTVTQNGGNAVKKSNGIAIASLICGIVAFLINPLYIVSIAAIVLGIIGLANAHISPKTFAVIGLILGFVSWGVQFVADLILSIFTFGLSFFI